MGFSVSIIVVCHNKVEYTRKCLKLLVHNTFVDSYELIVVDNASSDDTLDFLNKQKHEMPNLAIIQNVENLGFTGANNIGAQAAKGEYLFFLNNDTEVQPGWLEPLIEQMTGTASIGAVGCKLIYPNQRLQEAGGIIFRDGSGWNFGRGDDPADPEYSVVREVDYCSAAALMVRADVFRTVGGFDPLFSPAYWEDVDLCFSIRQHGYTVMYQPAAQVIHHEGATAGTNISQGAKRYQEINRSKFMRKWATELAQQPAKPDDEKTLRSLIDRRTRHTIQATSNVEEAPRGQSAQTSLLHLETRRRALMTKLGLATPKTIVGLGDIGITLGDGFIPSELGGYWVRETAYLFMWQEVLKTSGVFSLELKCGGAETYTSFPVKVSIDIAGIDIAEAVFTESYQTHLIRLPLTKAETDKCLRLTSTSVSSSFSADITQLHFDVSLLLKNAQWIPSEVMGVPPLASSGENQLVSWTAPAQSLGARPVSSSPNGKAPGLKTWTAAEDRAHFDLDILLKSAPVFRNRLATTKHALDPNENFWYRYDILANVNQLDKLLIGEYRNLSSLIADRPVLDIGAADGDLSFLLETFGVKCHIIDHAATNHNGLKGAELLKDALGSSVQISDVDLDTYFELPGQNYGLVFFLGILYHLKNPLYVLEALAKRAQYCLLSTRVTTFIDERGIDVSSLPIAYLLDTLELNNDPTNFWILTEGGLRRIANRAGWDVVGFMTQGSKNSVPYSMDRDQRAFCLLRSRTLGLSAAR